MEGDIKSPSILFLQDGPRLFNIIGMNPWEPELTVNAELASDLIGNQFPELVPLNIELLGAGWDNVVYRVNQKWFFRFPQRRMAVEGVLREIKSLPILEKFLGQVPQIRFVGKSSHNYPWPFFGYSPVDGKELTSHIANDIGWEKLAQDLGSYLSRLHSKSLFETLERQLPKDPLGRLDFNKRVPLTESRILELKKRDVYLPYEDLTRILKEGLKTPALPFSSVVHGDLHFRHVVVDSQRSMTGLIDWGDIHLNDAAVDLQIYWSQFKPNVRKIFQDSYGPISEVQLIQARSFSVFVNIALLISSLSQGHSQIAEKARESLQTLLED